MGHAEPGKPGEIEPWESDLIRDVAKRFDTSERKELEAELARTVLQIKANPPQGIRKWRRYLPKVLMNRANNWVDDWRRERRMVPILEAGEEHGTAFITEDELPVRPQDAVDRLALAQALRELDPEMQRLCSLLEEEGFNQVAVAKRLGKHRNTIRLWIRRIGQVLERHGFVGKTILHNMVTPPFRHAIQSRAGFPDRVKRDLAALEQRRFQALALLAKGLNQTEVSHHLRVARQTVNRWAKRHRQAGAAGLVTAERAGRKPFLNGGMRKRLADLLMRGPEASGYGASPWTCPRVAKLISDKFDLAYHVDHVWKLLRSLGWKFRRPIWKKYPLSK